MWVWRKTRIILANIQVACQNVQDRVPAQKFHGNKEKKETRHTDCTCMIRRQPTGTVSVPEIIRKSCVVVCPHEALFFVPREGPGHDDRVSTIVYTMILLEQQWHIHQSVLVQPHNWMPTRAEQSRELRSSQSHIETWLKHCYISTRIEGTLEVTPSTFRAGGWRSQDNITR